MTIKKYIKLLNELAEKYPNAKVIYSKDDEGNKFQLVNYNPGPGNFNGEDFIPDDNTVEFKINCICLN